MNVIDIRRYYILLPGRNADEKRATQDEHGALWFVIEADQFCWTLESVVTGQRGTLMCHPTPGRNGSGPWIGKTIQFTR